MSNFGRSARNTLASVIGYVIVALVALWVLRFALGTVFWLIRSVIAIMILAGLITLYLKVKSPGDD